MADRLLIHPVFLGNTTTVQHYIVKYEGMAIGQHSH
jgi:hypothetical protein